jgi:hypothetical protein
MSTSNSSLLDINQSSDLLTTLIEQIKIQNDKISKLELELESVKTKTNKSKIGFWRKNYSSKIHLSSPSFC